MRIESNELLPPTLWSLPMTGRRLGDRSSFDRIGNLQGAGGRASSVSSYTNDRLNQITSRSVPPYVDVLGVGNPTANVTVRVTGGTTYTAARKGEYFHHALNVPNSTSVYPSIEVKSLYGATQAETNKVFVAAATESPTHDVDGNLTQDGRWFFVTAETGQCFHIVNLRNQQHLSFDASRLGGYGDWIGSTNRELYETEELLGTNRLLLKQRGIRGFRGVYTLNSTESVVESFEEEQGPRLP